MGFQEIEKEISIDRTKGLVKVVILTIIFSLLIINILSFGVEGLDIDDRDTASLKGKNRVPSKSFLEQYKGSRLQKDTNNTAPQACYYYNPNNISTYEVIQFYDNSFDQDGDIVSWHWDFGDGESSNTPDPTHQYDDDGVYKVTLTVTDDKEATDTETKNITIKNRKPEADFSMEGGETFTGEVVNFTSKSSDEDGTVDIFEWDFGDGSVSNLENTSHAYPDDGDYNVTLTVIDDDESKDSVRKKITVLNRKPEVDFSFDPVHPYSREEINFTCDPSDPDGEIVSILWRFGDGGESSKEDPRHTYEDSGTYFITLEVKDDDNRTTSLTKKIEIKNRKPIANFSFTPNTPSTADRVDFDDMSSDIDGEIVGWKWSFGDGNQSDEVNPSHRYRDDGTYIVSLTVTDDDGKNCTIEKEIRVENQLPIPKFTFSPSDPCTKDVVFFNDTSIDKDGKISSWSWDFGDGHKSGNPEPTYKYADDGKYTVVLTVTDDDGESNTISKEIIIKNTHPEVYFTFDPGSPSTDDLIEFEDRSSDYDGSIIEYSWDFGDGTGSSKKDPAHIYENPGVYNVALTVKDDDEETATFNQNITVSNQGPDANFTIDPTVIYTSDVIEFSDSSYDEDGELVKWHWDFGDGEESSNRDPTHTYSDDGIYYVKLTVTDNDGIKDTASKRIKVNNTPPSANFSCTPINAKTGHPVKFYDESIDPDGYIYQVYWDFGDGCDSTNKKPSHIYSDEGVYTINLTVTDDDGAKSKVSKKIHISNRPPNAYFKMKPSTVKTNEKVKFTDESFDDDGEVVEWIWDFGDGNVSKKQNTTHDYSDVGTYEVSLTVKDDDGCIDTKTKTIKIKNRKPMANFSVSEKKIKTGERIEFIDTSYDPDGSIVSWEWDFDDGHHSDKIDPIHNYSDDGIYDVSLKIKDDSGCIDRYYKTIEVSNRPPVVNFSVEPRDPSTGDIVNFKSISDDKDGNIISWHWYFGDGNESFNSNDTYVTHTYMKDGVYNVTLKVTDDDYRSAQRKMVLEVKNSPPEPDFIYNPEEPKTLSEITFKDRSNDIDGSIVSWEWDFGDGYISNLTNPVHSYRDDGNYNVSLRLKDDDGRTSILTKTIKVRNRPPKIDINITTDHFESGDKIKFKEKGYDLDGEIVEWYWDFGDGNHSTLKDPTHRYFDDKTYDVKLKVIDNDGFSSVCNRTIKVKNKEPEADFSFEPSEYKTYEIINFTDRSTDTDGEIVDWYWEFGDSSISKNPYPTHYYDDEGIYEVRLTVVDDEGAEDTTSRYVEVINRAPIANFSWDPTVPGPNSTAEFIDNSIDKDGNIVDWSWDFGDGNKSELMNPSHVYDEPGNYTITLKVVDDDYRSSFINRSVDVGNVSPSINQTSVTPTKGNTSTLFNFYLKYMDKNDDKPEFIRVIIDGKKYEMEKTDCSDTEHQDGCYYEYSCKLSEGDHHYYFEVSDGFYTVKAPEKGSYCIEDIKQSLDVSIIDPKDSELITDDKIIITWEGIDEVTGIDHYNLNIDGTGWRFVGNNTSFSTDLTEGEHSIKVRATNYKGKTSIDEVEVKINSRIDDLDISVIDDDRITQKDKVGLDIRAHDEYSKIVEMRLGLDHQLIKNDTGWIIFEDELDYTLPKKEGNYTIYLKVRTEEGFVSRTVEDYIRLDKSEPTGYISVDNYRINKRVVNLTLSATDNFAEIGLVELSQDPDFDRSEIYKYEENIEFNISGNFGEQKIYVRFITVTNQTSKRYTAEVFYDNQGPNITQLDLPDKITRKDNLTQLIEWNSTDSSGIERYELYTGESKKDLTLYSCNLTESSCTYTFEDNKTYYIKITALDTLGNNNSVLGSTIVDVDYRPKIISCDVPTDVKEGKINFKVTANDCKDEQLNIEWYLNDTKIGSGSEVVKRVEEGEYIVDVKVTDGEYTISESYSLRVKSEETSILEGMSLWIICLIIGAGIAASGGAFYIYYGEDEIEDIEALEVSKKEAVIDTLNNGEYLTVPEIQQYLKNEERINIEKEDIRDICDKLVIDEKVVKKPSFEEEDRYDLMDHRDG